NLLTVMALFCSLGVAAGFQKKDVDLRAQDGTTLRASYFSPGRPGPAILLLHQCNMDRHAWDGLAQDLAKAGFHVLTFDFRGFGESGGGGQTDADTRRVAMREKWPGDVDTAYAYLTGQKGVDRTRAAVGGASCGVTQAADAAARHHEIKALLLLSGSASDAAKQYIAATPALAVFGAASTGDTGANKGIEEAVGSSKNPRSREFHFEGKEHGVPMFAKNPDLEPMIVNWLKAEVAGNGGSL
ncbi:MAG TPA: alpha/beta fold hydrolase, partial [Bryobacteraceae bacterium]|nr:alpha/beta fold hydrolase [Bryobacteraceae bacterium]